MNIHICKTLGCRNNLALYPSPLDSISR
uniref:Uncharacterized protein n=1 Tax=Anguilla anguilla TaxID=7936 RepID=A0A0E9XC34_ANGAN